MDPTHRLPVEVISLALDHMSESDIIPLASLSRQWRAIALDHPLFWQDIVLAAPSEGALALFRSRIQHGADRPTSVTVVLVEQQSTSAFLASALPLIVCNLHRIEELHLRVHVDTEPSVYQQLSAQRAPMLRGFSMEFHANEGITARCALPPDDLFARFSPRLEHIDLRGLRLNDQASWPSCFSSVSSVTFNFEPSESHALCLESLATMPSVRRVSVLGGTILDDNLFSDGTAAVLSRLVSLKLWLWAGTPCNFLSWSPVTKVPFMEILDRSPAAVSELTAHVPGHFHVGITPLADPLSFHTVYTSTTDDEAPVRKIVDTLRFYSQSVPRPSPAIYLPELVVRVVCLTIHASLWPALTPHMAPLPACGTVILLLDRALPPTSIEVHAALLPALYSLSLLHAAAGTMRLSAKHVYDFAQPWSSRISFPPLHIRLNRVRLPYAECLSYGWWIYETGVDDWSFMLAGT